MSATDVLPALEDIAALVRRAAREELLPRFGAVQRHVKHDGSLLTEADLAMQHRLARELSESFPQYDLLGEEMRGEEHEALEAIGQGRASRVGGAREGMWCLDPLDGTSNFAAGIPFFATSLALLVGGRAMLGLVYDPVRDECFAASAAGGAWLNGERLGEVALPPDIRRAIACVDFKRLKSPLAARLGSAPPYGSQRNFGASSLEWCWLADGRFHLYLHGGQKLWDYAAGCLILTEAGGRAVTLEGEEVFRLGLASRSVVASRDPGLFAAWREWLRAV
jgi:myo-inositol-1(or 4)-monophosphatase